MAEIWKVMVADEFAPELGKLPTSVGKEILARARMLQCYGPRLGRPNVDTLNGSRHANMKELRLSADGKAYRVAFAFDPGRGAVPLVAGHESCDNGKRFYRESIRKADERFDRHLSSLQGMEVHIGDQCERID